MGPAAQREDKQTDRYGMGEETLSDQQQLLLSRGEWESKPCARDNIK